MVVKAIVVVKDEDGTGEVLKWVTTLRNQLQRIWDCCKAMKLGQC